MRITKWTVLGLLALGVAVPGVADAAGKGKTKKAQKTEVVVPAGPTPVTATIPVPAGLTWGMSTKELAAAHDKYFEKAFLPRFKAAQPGLERTALEAELAGKQAEARNIIKFGAVPTGIDNTPLRGEYTYNNEEALVTVGLEGGVRRHFFFIQDKLWEIYDERPIGEGSKLGATFADVVSSFGRQKLKAEPFVTPANLDIGRLYTTAEWTDGRTVLRLVNREQEKKVAIVYLHQETLQRLPELRTHKAQEAVEVDPEISMLTRKADDAGSDSNASVADAYVKGEKAKKAKKAKEAKDAKAKPAQKDQPGKN